jgi:hypothetical protein
MTEKRRCVRVPLNVHACIKDQDNQSVITEGAVAVDISRSGISLEGADLNVGNCYTVEFFLPNGARFSGLIKVVWKHCGPALQKCGVQLVNIGFWTAYKLGKYVDNRCAHGRGWSLPLPEFLLVALNGLVWFRDVSEWGTAAALCGAGGIAMYLLYAFFTSKEEA